MLKPEQEAGRSKICEASVACERSTGFPAEVSAAQAILESNYLLAMPKDSNNCFGIKDTNRLPGASYTFTKEFINGTYQTKRLAFEVYPDLTACFTEHARLLINAGVYRPAWDAYVHDHNLDSFIRGISKHYATDPAYAGKITKLAHSVPLTIVIQQLRASANQHV